MASRHAAGETEEQSTIRDLARWVLGIRAADIPQAEIEQAKLLVLDTLGCGLAGRQDEIAHLVLGMIESQGGNSDCTIIGGGRTSLLNAVLANGVLIRVLDLNDYVINESKKGPESGGHPSDNIPVALSVGEARGSSGLDILTATVMGYELFARLQILMDRNGDWDGVTVSGLVAPAIAGKLMGLDEERLSHALALGLARAATPGAVRTGDLSAAKSLANAQIAESSVQATLLAERGATGPLAIFEQKRGLGALFAQGDPATILTAPMPEPSCIMRGNVKTYPCVATAQSAVSAAIALHRKLGGDAAKIAATVTGLELILADYPVLRRQAGEAGRLAPVSKESADHSFTFLAAVTLLDGRFGMAQFENERWHDPVITSLMDKMTIGFDPDWAARAPLSYPCSLVAHLQDGSSERIDIPYPTGFSRGQLDQTAVVEKFHAVTEDILGRPVRDRLVEAALTLDKAETVALLFDTTAR